MALPELPWNNLVDFVKDYTKGLQELVDALAPDPSADNSNFAIEPLYEYDSCLWYKGKVRFVTDQFNDSQHGNGYQGLVYASRITLQNNVLHVQSPTYMGKGQPAMDWNGYSSADYEVVKSVAENITMGIRNNYSDNDIVVHANQYGNVYFQPALHNKSDIGLQYTEMDTVRSSSELNLQFQNITLGWENDYVTNSTSLGELGTGAITLYQPIRTPVIAVIRNDSEASNLVSVFSPYNTHNNVLNATSQGSYKIYYGDNYIIYSIPSGTLIKYNDIFNSTNTVATTINGWNPENPPIVVPTYDENKHRDDPYYTDDNFGLTTTGFTSDIGGMGIYWLLDDVASLSGLFSDFNVNAPEGSMFSQHMLSCYVSALKHEWATTSHKMVLYTNGSQKPAYESTANYDLITQSNPSKIPALIEVPRCTETFLDFNPYTTYELYVPFCGWIGLPDTVAGRKIRVYMDFDASVCTCKARITVNMPDDSGETIIGEITGTFGAPCPIQVTEGGLYRQAMINSGLQIATGMAQGIAGSYAGASALAISGYSSALQGISNLNSANNTNYGQTIGRSGDTSGLCGGHYCYLRITHPVIDEVVFEQMFGHTIGYLCAEVGTLSDYEGFTVVLNPHITGIMCTEDEKKEIAKLLEQGVILSTGE